jgi:hypothetical protein
MRNDDANSPTPLELVQRKSREGTPLKWELKAESHLLPKIRLYLAWDRYPESEIVDSEKHTLIQKIDERAFNKSLNRFHVAIDSSENAIELARFFVALQEAPYLPEKLETRLLPASDGFIVELHYERTSPWGPPDNPEIAGSMTKQHTVTIQFKPERHMTILDAKERELRHSPS